MVGVEHRLQPAEQTILDDARKHRNVAVGQTEPDHGLNDRKQILHAVMQFVFQQSLMLLCQSFLFKTAIDVFNQADAQNCIERIRYDGKQIVFRDEQIPLRQTRQ